MLTAAVRATVRTTLASLVALTATPAPAAGLAIADPLFRQYENGPERLPTEPYRAGDELWLDCRATGYARAGEPDPRFALHWTWRIADAQGRLLVPLQEGKIAGELAAEDKDYRPRLRLNFQLPPLLPPGEYSIQLTLTDEIAIAAAAQAENKAGNNTAQKTETQASYKVTVEGRKVEQPAELAAAQFRFFRQEDDRRPLTEPVYRPGDAVWLRVDIAGFRHGEKNKIDVGYGLLVLGPSGQPFLRDDPAARHTAETFYPQFHVPAALRVQLPPKATPGEYIVLLTLRDHVSGATAAARTAFSVE